MMSREKMVNFAICRYIPDILRDEFINVGVVVHVPEDKFVHFYKTRNYRRIKAFDDEVELEVIKALLESLEYQFNSTTVHSPDFKGTENNDFLLYEISTYVNQLQFSNIRTFSSLDLDEDIKDLCDTYLYYDKKKSERIGPEKVRSLVSKMFSSSRINSIVKRNPEFKNIFQQQPFDFCLEINNNSTLIKAISFDYQSKNKFYKEIKSLLYDVQYFRDKDIHDIKLVINNTELNTDYEQNAFKILNEFTDVYTLEQFSKFVDEAEKDLN